MKTRSLSAMLALAALGFAAGAHAETTTRYSVLFQGKPAGAQTTVTDDNRVTVDYSYRNNGRGPDVKEEYSWSREGILKSFRLTGKSTVGSAIDESYVREGDKATWKSTADKGEITAKGSTFYLPASESSIESLAALVRTAVKAGGRIDAVPAGEVAVRKLESIEVAHGDEKRKVALYALTGIALQPSFVWLDDDAALTLFGFVDTGFAESATLLQGWETVAPTLRQRQLAAEGDMLSAFAQKHRHPLAGTTVIRNARVFDSMKAVLGEASDVYVEGGKVVEIAAAGKSRRKADQSVDAAGRVLLPGLFDMHGHESAWAAPLHIAAGVTTVRDLGNDNTTLAELSAKIEDGTRLGARIVPAGFIEGESPYSARYGFVIKDLAGAKKAIDWYAEHHYPQIKIYNSFPKEILKDTTAYAHEKGMRVSGHVPVFLRAEDAVRQGYDEIQHINQLMLNFYAKPDTDTRTLARFYLVAENAHSLDLDSKPVRDFVALLKEHGTVIDPTLTVFEAVADQPGHMMQSYRAVADHFPVSLQRQFSAGIFDVPDDKVEIYRGAVKKMAQFVGVMYRAGIPVVAGTDSLAGFTLHRELQVYVEGAGMTPAQALQIATVNGAKYTRTSDRLGAVATGKPADLVLVDGDPVKDITALHKIALVMKGGTAYYPDEIYRDLGIKPFTASLKPAK